MHRLSALVVLTALMATGVARAAAPPSDAQTAITNAYKVDCAAALDPTDANFAAAAALLASSYVMTDLKGKQHTRDEVIAMNKQELKQLQTASCDNQLGSMDASGPSTIVVVNTVHVTGTIQAPDGNHAIDATDKAQDTWSLVGGQWLQTQSKELHTVVKIDGNVAQDDGQ